MSSRAASPTRNWAPLSSTHRHHWRTTPQRPLAGLAFAEKATAAAWRTKPAWAVVSSSDTTIDPEVQRFGYRRAGIDFVEIDSSHMVMLSHPDEVVDIILEAVEATK